MKKLMLIFAVLFLAGCGGQKVLELYSGQNDAKGKPIMYETTESIEISKSMAVAVEKAPLRKRICELGFSFEEVESLSATGQAELFRSLGDCWRDRNTVDIVKAARGNATDVSGAITQYSMRGIKDVEDSDALEHSSDIAGGTRVLSLGLGVLGLKWAVEGGGNETTYGDTTVNASNSGTSAGGEGGAGQTGDRNLSVSVNGSTSNFQPGDSNTQATAEKATSVDNPIVSGGPNNSIVNDADANGTDASLF